MRIYHQSCLVSAQIRWGAFLCHVSLLGSCDFSSFLLQPVSSYLQNQTLQDNGTETLKSYFPKSFFFIKLQLFAFGATPDTLHRFNYVFPQAAYTKQHHIYFQRDDKEMGLAYLEVMPAARCHFLSPLINKNMMSTITVKDSHRNSSERVRC